MRRTLFLTLICAALPSLLWAKGLALSPSNGINEANRLYAQGKYDEAVETYQKAADADAKNSLARYDLGTALYKKGDFDRSVKYLQESLSAKEPDLRLKARYNLGNALYQSGMAQEQQNVDGAIASLQKSLDNFDDVIKADAKDADARYNRDIVQKELERLTKKREEQKKEEQKKQQQQKQGQNQPGAGDKQNPQDRQDQDKGQNKDQGIDENKGQEQHKQQGQGQAENAQTMAEGQAKDLLEQYERDEAPAKLLNFIPKKGDEQGVDKDW